MLSSGLRFGPYEIASSIGAGGATGASCSSPPAAQFTAALHQILSVPVTWSSAGPEFGVAQPLVTASADSTFGTMFDVTPDGQRFVVIMEGERSRSPITVRLGRRE
jgi:hypothetical protein